MWRVSEWWGFAALLGAWVLAQIAYPLTGGGGRDLVVVVVVGLAAGISVLHAWVTGGGRWVAGLVVIVAGVGLVVEIAGVRWGFPFGCYGYAAGRLGPEIAGVPWVVPLAWVGGWYPVRIVAGYLSARGAVRVVLTAVGAVGWDLFLDPQMVADGQWVWCSARARLPGLAGIPYTNFLGWFGVALVMAVLWELPGRRGDGGSRVWSVGELRAAAGDSAAVLGRTGHGSAVAPGRTGRGSVEPFGRYGWVPVVMFLWTWLGSALAHAVFLGLPWSAGYGWAGMGVLGVPLVLSWARRWRP
ncbi:carotenoid biosynthesis protein [Nocardia sp. alder85J]|nr:carotenoid biosynthesis protein [Nocardia sp. alder85J]MCX4098754.1 carotenoid biosynthesis protein [Nocardia sp. alder85J]